MAETEALRKRVAELEKALAAAQQEVALREDLLKTLPTGNRRLQDESTAFFDLMPDLACVADLETSRLVKVNSACHEILGFTAEEMCGQPFSNFIHPDDVQTTADAVAKQTTGSAVLQFENRYRHKDGSYRRLSWSATPPVNGHVFGVARDITDLKKKDAALADSLRLADDLFRASFSGIYVYQYQEPDRLTLIDANETAEKMTGVNLCEWQGREFNEIWPQARKDGYTDVYLDVARTGKSFEGENLTYKDQRIDVAIRARIFALPNKRVAVSFEDVSERKAIEEQLSQSQKLESIGALAGGIAHDFNNILQGVLGNADLARDAVPKDSDLYTCLEQIMAAGNRGADLVRRLLLFSQPSAPKREPINVQFAIGESLGLLRPSLPATIEIREEHRDRCGLIMGDATELQQVLVNLCTNAHHAMREKPGVISIGAGELQIAEQSHIVPPLEAGRYVCVTVRDTGTGMDEATRSRVFEPFFTTKPRGVGTGLGLSVAFGIVRGMGGGFRLKSELGQGTLFEVFFPLAPAEALAALHKNDELPGVKGNERLLVVDDEEIIVFQLKRGLGRLGYDVEGHVNSEEALAAFLASPEDFDAVITDQTMPRLPGLALAKQLLEVRPDIPIIICTGHSEALNNADAQKLGIRDFVMKPAMPRELARIIRRILQNPASITLPT